MDEEGPADAPFFLPPPQHPGHGDVALKSTSPLDATLATGRVPLTAEETRLLYGPRAVDEDGADTLVRQLEEQLWMCPRPEQVQTKEEHSKLHGGFECPDRTLVIGTNGSHCYALVCVREPGSKPDPVLRITQEDSAEAEALKYYGVLSHPVAKYKMLLLEQERKAFEINHTFRMRTTDDPARLSANLMKHGRADIMLREPVRALTDPARKYKPLKPGIHHAKRTSEGATVVEHATMDFCDPPPPRAPQAGKAVFELAVFATAQMSRGWKPSGIVFRVAHGTVPVAALGDTTLAVLSVPNAKHAVLCLECFDVGPTTFRPKPRSTRYLTMPDVLLKNLKTGMLKMHVNGNGTISIAYANGVLVVPAEAAAAAAPISIFTTNNRTVTAAPIFGAATMAMCTDQGECLLFSTTTTTTTTQGGGDGEETPPIRFYGIMLPAPEPIYDAHWVAASGWLYLHTVNEVACAVVATGDLLVTTFVRPTCMAACGAVLFVGNKSGIIAAKRPLLREERARYFDPPKRKGKHDTRMPMLQQIAYRGMHASRTRVTFVDESGIVMVLKIE